VDQSGNVGINTIADPSYNLDVRKNGYGDILRLRNESLSAGADIDLLLGGTHVVGTYLNSAKTATWPHGTPLFLKSGGTTVAVINGATGPNASAFNLNSSKLTIGSGPQIAGTAGQVLRATGVDAGVEWGTGGGGDASGGGIPYEPWGLCGSHGQWGMVDHTVYYMQFPAPATADYNAMSIYTTNNSSATFGGIFGVAIYTDDPTSQPGTPKDRIGTGATLAFTSPSDMKNRHITFDLSASPIPLIKDTLYWAAVAVDISSAFVALAWNPVHDNSLEVCQHEITVFTGTMPATASVTTTLGDFPLWFRIYDTSANFGGGPIGPTGPTGPAVSIGTDISGTEGSVLFVGPSGVLAEDNAHFFWNDSSNNLGIGTALPSTKLQVSDISNVAPFISTKRRDSNITNGTNLGGLIFTGTDPALGDTDGPLIGAQILAQGAGTWGTGVGNNNCPANIRFLATIDGSPGTQFEHMRIAHSGNVGIFHNTVPGFNPQDPNILHIRTINVDANIMVETVPLAAGITSSLTLVNFPSAGTTLTSTSDPIGSIKVQVKDTAIVQNISQINSFLVGGVTTNFTSNVEFELIADGSENTVMEMRGADTVTGLLPAGFGKGGGLLYRNYCKFVGTLGPYSLTDADSGMHIWASTNAGSVIFVLPGHQANTVQTGAPLAGTHYRFICNANSVGFFNIVYIESSNTLGLNLKMFGVVAHGGLLVEGIFGTFTTGPSPNTISPGGNDAVSLGTFAALGDCRIGDYIDIMFNGSGWFVSGIVSGVNADPFGGFGTIEWYP